MPTCDAASWEAPSSCVTIHAMNVTATAPVPTPAPSNKLSSVIADGLRSIGTGVARATDMNGLVVDKAYIYPVESVYTTGKLLKAATGKVPQASRVVGQVFNAGGFITAFHGMIMANMLRAPGQAVRELTHAAADAIDGQKTTSPGMMLPIPPR